MADLTRSSISISATPAEVMRVIADFAAYPEWIRFLKGVEVVETDAAGRGTVVRFVLDAGVVVDDYTLAYVWADDEVSWHLLQGTSIRAMDGSYHLAATETEAGTGTEVAYALSIDIDMPLLGVFKRKAEQVLIDTALRALKERVEP